MQRVSTRYASQSRQDPLYSHQPATNNHGAAATGSNDHPAPATCGPLSFLVWQPLWFRVVVFVIFQREGQGHVPQWKRK